MSEHVITISSFFDGDRSGKVRWLAYELGFDVVEDRVPYARLRDDDFAKRSPLRVIPLVTSNGIEYRESTAIGHVLVETHGPHLGVPVGDPRRAAYLTWISTFVENTEQKLVECALSRAGRYPPEVYETNAPRLRRRLSALAALLPADGHLCGDFTFADIVAAYSLRLAVQYDLLERAAIEPWLTRVMARPAAREANFFDGL